MALARPVEIAPERPGTASALLDALARQDGAAVRIEIELTAAELAKVLGGLGDAQRAAFLGNGLRAALLA